MQQWWPTQPLRTEPSHVPLTDPLVSDGAPPDFQHAQMVRGPTGVSIWFGVVFCMNMQMSFLSPPFGPAAFYLKSVAPPDISLGTIFRSLLPFIGLQILAVGLLLFFPGITGR